MTELSIIECRVKATFAVYCMERDEVEVDSKDCDGHNPL